MSGNYDLEEQLDMFVNIIYVNIVRCDYINSPDSIYMEREKL